MFFSWRCVSRLPCKVRVVHRTTVAVSICPLMKSFILSVDFVQIILLRAIHMIPEWPLFWNEFIQSPYISLYLFTWYRKDIWSRTNHSGMSSFPVFAIIRHFVLVLCELKTNFENHASLNALGWAVRCYHVNAIWTSLSNETHSRMTFIPLSYKQPLTLVNSVCEKIENV